MSTITLVAKDIDALTQIQAKLSQLLPLSTDDCKLLSDFLSRLPETKTLLAERIPLDNHIDIKLWDMGKFEENIKYWELLFDNIPGYDYVGCLPTVETQHFLQKGIILIVTFSPTYSYNLTYNDGPEIWLYENGIAKFSFSRLQDAEQYPELYNFNGSWKDAYFLLIETLKKGWPMEEFPQELLLLLKK